MSHPDEWNALPAVRSGHVYALEANSYLSRPGPRLITGIEALASVFHPGMPFGEEAQGAAQQVAVRTLNARAAST